MTKGSARRRMRVESARNGSHAQRLLEAGRFAEAIESLQGVAQYRPNDGGVLNDLGSACLRVGRFQEAITWLRRSIAVRSSSGHTHYNLGLALEELGDREAAILEYREVVALSPGHAKAQARLGDLLWDSGARSEAVSAYRRAAATAPDTTLGCLCEAMALRAEDRHREAEDKLRQLIARDPSGSMAHRLLGKILQEAGRHEEATSSFENSIAIAPLETDAYQGLVSSKRFTDADRTWIARILSALEAIEGWRGLSPDRADRHRMALHFAAGKIFDDLGDCAKAIGHFDIANALRRQKRPFKRDVVEQLVDGIIARFTPKFRSDHLELGHDDPTPILIVGMPRSGTTLLERIVSSHPSVRGCGELDFWNERGPTLLKSDPDNLAAMANQIQRDYLNLLRRSASNTDRATDKMPFNFLWMGIVHVLFPNARFIHSRRNAVDTCLSIYMTPMNWGFVSERRELAWYYRMYLRLMEHWRAVIPSNRLIELDYEDVVAEPERTARRLLEFLELEWDPACLRPEQNGGSVMTASHWQVRQPIYRRSVERWRRYEPWIGELRQLLP
jgi:tetratricopeptide (TPR) repeat protein